MAAGLLDEAEHLAEPEPGALAHRLGGEERVEGLRATSGGMPMPVSVTAISTYCPAVTSAWAARIGVVEMAVGRLDGQPAAVGHGVAAVDGEVERCAFSSWLGSA